MANESTSAGIGADLCGSLTEKGAVLVLEILREWRRRRRDWCDGLGKVGERGDVRDHGGYGGYGYASGRGGS